MKFKMCTFVQHYFHILSAKERIYLEGMTDIMYLIMHLKYPNYTINETTRPIQLYDF